MLDRFRQAKQTEIELLKRNMPKPYTGSRPDFASVLQKPGIAIIAEYKRASPSRGIIREELTVEDVSGQYEKGGAAAISILTEEKYFKGDSKFISRARAVTTLPILRKDFIFHPLQIQATAATPASALLLIVRMLESQTLRELHEQAERLGLASVVEVFDEEDIAKARDAGAQIIQVNARDLSRLEVDRNATLELINKAIPRVGELWIAASGIEDARHVKVARDAGFNAVLVGTALMQAQNPGEALRNLQAWEV